MKKYLFLPIMAVILVLSQGKSCNGGGGSSGGSHPPPPATKKTVKISLPPRTEGSDPNTFPYPYEDGFNDFPSYCTFSISDIASITVWVYYHQFDANGVRLDPDLVYSVQSFTSSQINPAPIMGSAPSLDIEVPTDGYYYLKTTYTFLDCHRCCGTYDTYGTGVPGCPATPATKNKDQGKPEVTGVTLYSYHGPFETDIPVNQWANVSMQCKCNCL